MRNFVRYMLTFLALILLAADGSDPTVACVSLILAVSSLAWQVYAEHRHWREQRVKIVFGLFDFQRWDEAWKKYPAILVCNNPHEQEIAHYWIEDNAGERIQEFVEEFNKLPMKIQPDERKKIWFYGDTYLSEAPRYTNRVRACIQLDNDKGKIIRSRFVKLREIAPRLAEK